jgi:flagellar assembly protein FliH
MPSSEATPFVPFGGTPPGDAFRPLGTPAPVDPAPQPDPDPCALAYEAGREQGRADAAAEQVRLARAVAATLEAVQAWRAELRTRYTPTLVTLAIEIARKIVGDALDARPERWVPIVAGAIRRLVDREQVTVRTSPRLAALLREHAGELGGDRIQIVDDASLADDACRVESSSGDVDCGLAAQLAAVVEAIREAS